MIRNRVHERLKLKLAEKQSKQREEKFSKQDIAGRELEVKGKTAVDQGNYQKSIEYGKQALPLFTTEATAGDKAVTLMNLGTAYLNSKEADCKTADYYFRKIDDSSVSLSEQELQSLYQKLVSIPIN